MTTPDPKTVRAISRKFLLDAHMTHSEFKACIRDYIGADASDETFTAWYDAVRADVRWGRVETVASWPDEQPQDERDARIAELERELRKLRGTELNPSPLMLDAEGYRYLADEIGATMMDEWDGDEAESWILVQYVRWLAAGQPRDEDGYPVRRETYPPFDAKAAQDERDVQLAEVTAELDAANANAAEIADQRTAYREEIMRLRARVRELEGTQDEHDSDVRADAFDLDCEELVEIFAEFIGEWDRSHEVITVGLPDHLPQLRIPHLRRAVVALQRLGRERDAALKARDGDVRAVDPLRDIDARVVDGLLKSQRRPGEPIEVYNAICLLIGQFGGRIEAMDAALEARNAKGGES